jgi:hypothetical protein
MVELNCKRVVRGCSGDGWENGGGTFGYLGYDLVWMMDGFKEGCRLVRVDGGLNGPGHMHIVCRSVAKAGRVQAVNYCVMVKRRSAFAGFTLYRSSSSFPWLFGFTLGRLQDLHHRCTEKG